MAKPSPAATLSQDLPCRLSNTTPRNLTDMPRELRDEIYRLCLVPETISITRFHFNNKPIIILSNTHDHRPKILFVNRQIRAEALPLFYRGNTFHFADLQLAKLFLHSLAEQDLLCHLQDMKIAAKSSSFKVQSAVLFSERQRGIKVFAQSILARFGDQGLRMDAVRVQVCVLHAPMPKPDLKLGFYPDELRRMMMDLGCRRLHAFILVPAED